MLGIFSGNLVNPHNNSGRWALLLYTHTLLLIAVEKKVMWISGLLKVMWLIS